MTEIIKPFRIRLKEALEYREMRAVDLCKKTGISQSTMSQYISGYAEPKKERLNLIANALNVNPTWLMGLDVSMDRTDKEKLKKSFDELRAFDAELSSLGWKCELFYCNAWEEVELGAHEGTPVGCILPDNIHRKCDSCYMKTPKYVFSNGITSFEVSSKDYSDFLKDSKAFFLKRIQKLMLKSTNTLFETELNAANAIQNASTEDKQHDDDIMNDENL